MTPEQLASVKVGDTVRLREAAGKVTQSAATWFIVTWHDAPYPEVIKRRVSILTTRLEFENSA